MRTIQQLNTQLRETAERSRVLADRLREKDERLTQLREEHDTQLQQKEVELQQRNADISTLQRQLQVCMSNLTFYDYIVLCTIIKSALYNDFTSESIYMIICFNHDFISTFSVTS